MKNKGNKIIASASILLFLSVAGIVYHQMTMVKSQGFEVVYQVNGQDYKDGKVFRKWGDKQNYYLHLPQSSHHPWWRFQLTAELLQSVESPKKIGPFWWTGKVLKGPGIDFEVKIGPWDYAFTGSGITFENEVLACEVQFPG